MRLALVGTSNSVLKEGFSTALASSSLVSALGNFSIGASSSVHVVKSTSGVDFSVYDFCLFDFAVNEDVLLRNGATSPDQVRHNLDYLVTRCLQAGCLPVIVVFPKPIKAEVSESRDFYLEYARSLHLPCFDGYEALEYLGEKHGLTLDQLFLDKTHVKPWVARFFADTILESLQRLVSKKGETVPGHCQAAVLDQIALSSIDLISDDHVYRQNTKFQDAFCILRNDGYLEVDIPDPHASVMGICVNLAKTSCILSIEGVHSCLIDLRNGYFENSKIKLTISMLPLRYSIQPKDGKVKLRFVSVNELGKVPIPMQGVLGQPAQSAPKNILEISRLLIQKSESISVNKVPAPQLYRNLFADCEEDRREALFQKQHAVSASV